GAGPGTAAYLPAGAAPSVGAGVRGRRHVTGPVVSGAGADAAAGGQPGRRTGVTCRGLGTRGLVAAQPGISWTARAELRRPPKPATGGTPRGTGPVAVFHANGCRGCRGQRSGSRYVTVGKSRMSVFRTSC